MKQTKNPENLLQKQSETSQKQNIVYQIPGETTFLGSDTSKRIVFPDNSSIVGISISELRKSGVPESLLKLCKYIEIPDLKRSE